MTAPREEDRVLSADEVARLRVSALGPPVSLMCNTINDLRARLAESEERAEAAQKALAEVEHFEDAFDEADEKLSACHAERDRLRVKLRAAHETVIAALQSLQDHGLTPAAGAWTYLGNAQAATEAHREQRPETDGGGDG